MKSLSREQKSDRPIKVIQFGGGNFLRAYVDWMIEILNKETDFNGDVLIVKPTEKGDYEALRHQDGLYHVFTTGIKDGILHQETNQITCIQEVIHPYRQWETYLESATDPNIRFIISNTTESGITYNQIDQNFENTPKEFPAKLCAWLYKRWQHFKGDSEKGCILLPCELIIDNGKQLKECLLQYASLWSLELEFKNWLKVDNFYCNTLVDRIVSGFPTSSKEKLLEELGQIDTLMVESELYHLFVIEGPPTVQKELPFDQTKLNVIFTNELGSYRTIKVRLLNGAHTSMVPLGYLSGKTSVREAIEDPELGQFISDLLLEEVVPTLDFPDEVLTEYVSDVINRFRNPQLHHKLIDISLNSTSKFKTRLLPSLLEYKVRTRQFPKRILKALSALIVFYRGKRGGETIPLRDDADVIKYFQDAWDNLNNSKDTGALIKHILSNENIWEQDLTSVSGMSEALTDSLNSYIENNQNLFE